MDAESRIVQNKIYHGDCLEVMRGMAENSLDAVVCDPPYELTSIVKRFGKKGSAPAKPGTDGRFTRLGKGFMGRAWDGTGIGMRPEVWQECLRVAKPGAYLLAFGGTRTFHRLACAIEDAGWTLKDTLSWNYGSGFPKSHDVGKSIDKITKRLGLFVPFAEHFKEQRQFKKLTHKDIAKHFPSRTGGMTGCVWNWENAANVPTREQWKILQPILNLSLDFLPLIERVEAEREVVGKHKGDMGGLGGERLGEVGGDITMPATPEAKQWDGFGTALKPAWEPILLFQKPLEGTYAENVLKWGCGALNVLESKVVGHKTDTFFDYVKWIARRYGDGAGVGSSADNGHAQKGVAFVRNLGKLLPAFLEHCQTLSFYSSDGLSEPNNPRLQDFLDDCPACFRLCDALAHYSEAVGLITQTQLSDARKHIRKPEHWDCPCPAPSHSHPTEHSAPRATLGFCFPDECPDEPLHGSAQYRHACERYLELCLSSTHTCQQGQLNFAPPDKELQSALQLFCQIASESDRPDLDSCFSSIWFILILIITHTARKVNRKKLEKSRWPANALFQHSLFCEKVGEHEEEGYTINRFTDGAKPFGGGAGHPYESERRGKEVVEEWRCVPECPIAILDAQSGETVTRPHGGKGERLDTQKAGWRFRRMPSTLSDRGGASRFFRCFELKENELLLERAKAILSAWNKELANTVDDDSRLSNEHAASALEAVVLKASQGAMQLSDLMGLFMNVTPMLLRWLCENVIMAILNIDEKSLPASFHIATVKSSGNLVKYVEQRKPTDTTTTIASPTNSGGSAVVITLDIMPSNTEAGEAASAARFKYCAKASREERNAGLEGMPDKVQHRTNPGGLENDPRWAPKVAKNPHPTVKPINLLRYLCRLATPPGGTVLDCFAGSGSTGCAAVLEGFQFVGIEKEREYVEIMRSRIEYWARQRKVS